MKYNLLTYLILFFNQLAFSQHDASLTYIDLIAKCNHNVKENLNQKLTHWDEIPDYFTGIKKITERHYYQQFDDSIIADTLITIDTFSSKSTLAYINTYRSERKSNDTLTIHNDSFYTSADYIQGRLISSYDEESTMNYFYYDSGELERIELNSKPFISSRQNGDTTFYSLDFNRLMHGQPVKLENVPTISIRSIKLDTDCYLYQNVFEFDKMLDAPVINKSFKLCNDGKMYDEVILSRYDNYQEIESDYEFIYNTNLLIEKRCRPTAKYYDYKQYRFQYDENGNLLKIIGETQTTSFKYDDRNNIIEKLIYSSGSKSLNKAWYRKIEYFD